MLLQFTGQVLFTLHEHLGPTSNRIPSTHCLSSHDVFALIETQSQGYFCLCVAPRSIPRPALKTSATDFTWRQRLNEHGSMNVNTRHISFGSATSCKQTLTLKILTLLLLGFASKFSLYLHAWVCWYTARSQTTSWVHEWKTWWLRSQPFMSKRKHRWNV